MIGATARTYPGGWNGVMIAVNSDNPSPPSRRYLLVTPCRDEAKFARRTLESVARQTIPPALWIVVDDGSTDETPGILAEYAARLPYLKVIRRENRGFRKLGGGVIDAFYSGYDTINPRDFDYVCKFDLDLDLPAGYFQALMERMEADPRIGTCSGKPYFKDSGGKQISEMCGDENSVGMVKFYRTACFTQIGGFVRELMWDGIDCHRCRMLGWIAVSWDDPQINFEHLRPMGTSHKNWWTGRVRHGVGQYFMGTGPAYMLASALFRMSRPPIVIGGVAMLWGYLRSMLQRKERYGDAAFRRFLRAYQWRCLFFGKARATRECNARQAVAWEELQPTLTGHNRSSATV
ncbi:MAG: glycosyl transferase family 2 [Phycisphaerales bacterium]|nr:glycosyl transferase family 2 [Phycisphaerales bacterium]